MAYVVNVIENGSSALGALARYLERAGYSTHNYTSAEAFLNDYRNEGRACVVTELRLPGMNGLELMRKMFAEKGARPIILVVADSDVGLAVSAIENTINPPGEKTPDLDLLMASVRQALDRSEGNSIRIHQSPEVRRRLEFLSHRERQVLDALVAGKPNKVIARDLKLSPRTIEGYRATVMAKMHARSLSSLIRMVLVGSIEA